MAIDIEDLLNEISYKESRHNPRAYNPKSGAAGQYQFLPATARQYGLRDPYDPVASRNAARRMIMDLAHQYNGDIPKILAAYNWGSGNLAEHGMENAPAETRDYINTITGRLSQPKRSVGERVIDAINPISSANAAEFPEQQVEQPAASPDDEIAQWRAERATKAQPAPAPAEQSSDEIAQWRAERATKAQQPQSAPAEQGKQPYWGNERSVVYTPFGELDRNAKGAGSFWERLAANQIQGLSDFGAEAGSTMRTLGNLAADGAGDAILKPENINPETSVSGAMGSMSDPVAAFTGLKAFNAINGARALAKTAPWINSMLSGAGSGAAVALPSAATELKQGDVRGAVGDLAGGAALGGGLTGGANAGGYLAQKGVENIFYPSRNMASRLLREGFSDADRAIGDLRRGGGMLNAPTAGKFATSKTSELKVIEESAKLGPLANKYLAKDEAAKLRKISTLEDIAAPAYPARSEMAIDQHDIAGMSGKAKQEIVRKNITDPFYQKANPANVYLDPAVEAKMADLGVVSGGAGPLPSPSSMTPSQLRQFAEQGDLFGKNNIRNPDGTISPRPSSVPQGLSMQERPKFGTFSPVPTRTISNLQGVKADIDNQLNNLSGDMTEVGRAKVNELRSLKKNLDERMIKTSPDYAEASRLYKQESAPLNQGNIAIQLRKAIVNEGNKYTPNTFLNTYANKDKLLKNAGIDHLYNNVEDVLTPSQQRSIQQLRKRVMQDVRYRDLNTTGMSVGAVPLATELEKASPNTLSRKLNFAKKALGLSGGWQKKKMQAVIDEAWLHPNTAADLLEQQPLLQREKFIRALRRNDYNKALMGNIVNNTVD
jgi:hypothetical protein